MVNTPGRSSGSWFILLPAPSHLLRETYNVKGETQDRAIHE